MSKSIVTLTIKHDEQHSTFDLAYALKSIAAEWDGVTEVILDFHDATERKCDRCKGSGEVWLGSQPYGSPGDSYAPCECGGTNQNEGPT